MDNIQLSLFGRTYPELFQVTAERILEPCLKKSQTPIFQCLQVANGQPQEWLEGGRLTQLGESLTLNIGEYPNVENESTLSEILEDNVPEKYYLSPKACLGILRRAKNKGRKLPDNLRIALEQKVAEGGEVLGLDFAHADSVVRTYKDITPTLVQNMGRGGGQTPCIMYEEKRSVIPLRDEVTRNKASNGLGVGKVGGPCPTLTTADIHSVFYEAYQHHGYRESDTSGTLTAGQNNTVRGDNLKNQIAKVKAGEERKDRLDRSVASYRGILSHFDSYGLRQSLNTLFKENGMVEKKEEVSRCTGNCNNCPNYTESYFCGFATPYCKLQGKEITHNVY